MAGIPTSGNLNGAASSHTCCRGKTFKVELILLTFSLLSCNLFSPVLSLTDTVDASSLLADCTNIQPSYPPPNTFACYRTRIQQLGPFQTCEASFVRQAAISKVIDGTANYTIYHLHSPGRLRERTYVNKLLCRWNIQCPQNQLMYMDIVEHDIEPQRQARLFRRPVCVDYLKMFRDFGSETTCDHLLPHSELEPGRLLMEFRSNKRVRYPGFNMRIVCFNPELQEVKGCSPTLSLRELGITQLRNKRSATDNTPTKSTRFYSRQAYSKPFSSVELLKNVSKGSPGKHGIRNRRNYIQQQTFLEEDSTVIYRDQVLNVVSQGGKPVESFGNIRALHTYTPIEGLQSFYSPTQEVELTGRALLTVIQNVAYYYRFGVDEKFKPNDNEEVVIRAMLETEEQLVVDQDIVIEENEGDASTDETPLEISAADSEHDEHSGYHDSVRGKRQTSVSIDERVINAARVGADSCNAIVRAVAQSLLRLAGEL